MKLDKIERDHPLLSKLKLGAMGLVIRERAPDVIRLMLYRPELFGHAFIGYINALLRGHSEWTVGERELFAAWVSRANQCEFCTTNHRVNAARAMGEEVIDAVFDDPSTAPVSAAVRECLTMLDKLVREPAAFEPAHARAVLDAGASADAVRQAMHIASAFSTINALADGLGFEVPSLAAFRRMAPALLKHGYSV